MRSKSRLQASPSSEICPQIDDVIPFVTDCESELVKVVRRDQERTRSAKPENDDLRRYRSLRSGFESMRPTRYDWDHIYLM